MPVAQFSVNASAGVGTEEYPGTNFGLRNNDNNVYSLGVDFVPLDSISMGVTYGYEKYTALQASRTANPLPAGASNSDPTQQFNDPRRDWTNDSTDDVRTWNASVDLLKVIPRTELRVGYDYSNGDSTYVYGLAPNTTIATPGAAAGRDQPAAARHGGRPLLRDAASGPRAGLLVRQVRRHRFRAGSDREPGVAGHRHDLADAARELLSAVFGEHVLGEAQLLLVSQKHEVRRQGRPTTSDF